MTDITTGNPYEVPTGSAGRSGIMYVEDGTSVLHSITENGDVRQRVGLIKTSTDSPTITNIAAQDDGTCSPRRSRSSSGSIPPPRRRPRSLAGTRTART